MFFGYKRPNKDPAKETKGGEAKKKKTDMIESEKLNLPSRNFAYLPWTNLVLIYIGKTT